MDIIITNSGGIPIYEQITSQVKAQIMSGKLKEGDALPSMRVLAKELRISLITTKRAYEDLEREGYIESFTGKGSYVKPKNMELVREEQLRKIDDAFVSAANAAKMCGITLEDLQEILSIVYGGNENE